MLAFVYVSCYDLLFCFMICCSVSSFLLFILCFSNENDMLFCFMSLVVLFLDVMFNDSRYCACLWLLIHVVVCFRLLDSLATHGICL